MSPTVSDDNERNSAAFCEKSMSRTNPIEILVAFHHMICRSDVELQERKRGRNCTAVDHTCTMICRCAEREGEDITTCEKRKRYSDEQIDERTIRRFEHIVKGRRSSFRRRRRRRNLPVDVIEQILLRLTPSCILRFRSVCKVFDELSSSPAFFLAHRQHCRRNYPTSIVSCLHDVVPRVLYVKNSFPKTSRQQLLPSFSCLYYELSQACDGLLCLTLVQKHKGKELLLFNPLTRESLFILIPIRRGYIFFVIGFFYHALSRRYKLLVEYLSESSYCVLTFGPITLTTIQKSAPYAWVPGNTTPLIQGNRLCSFGYTKQSVCVIVFHTDTQLFTHLPFPDGFVYINNFIRTYLLEIEERLCICQVDFKSKVELWVLKDYDRGIWIKKKNVHLKRLQAQRQDCHVALLNGTSRFLYVEFGTSGIESPEKSFNFYYSDNEQLRNMKVSSVTYWKTYRESLATIGMLSYH